MLPAIKRGVRRIIVLTILCAGGFSLCLSPLRAEGPQESTKKFVYKDASGRVSSVQIIHHYWRKPIVHPFAKIDRVSTQNSRARPRSLRSAPTRNRKRTAGIM